MACLRKNQENVKLTRTYTIIKCQSEPEITKALFFLNCYELNNNTIEVIQSNLLKLCCLLRNYNFKYLETLTLMDKIQMTVSPTSRLQNHSQLKPGHLMPFTRPDKTLKE